MIEPTRAMALVARHCPAPVSTTVSVEDSLGHVLARDVDSPIALPSFDNSAMDGFALVAADTGDATPGRPRRLVLDGTVFAGDPSIRRLRRGFARGIMTGAPVPPGADAVVPRELALVDDGELLVKNAVVSGQHVRRQGEEIARGARLLNAGVPIHAGTIAVLATAGSAKVHVYRKPRVAIIATGNETRPPGARLKRGEIYDSNTAMLSAMVRSAGFDVVRTRRVRDHAAALQNAVRAAIAAADVTIVCGGVSVGDRDYLRSVLERLRVREVFWRVNQKPGKPLYFGAAGRRLVFGLPGNPASAFTCFHLYVYPALRRIAGFPRPEAARVERRLRGAVASDAKRWCFLKARDGEDQVVEALPAQGSHMTTSLAHTNALIAVPPARGEIAAGTVVDTYLLSIGEVWSP